MQGEEDGRGEGGMKTFAIVVEIFIKLNEILLIMLSNEQL
jgi:hypothetical protein